MAVNIKIIVPVFNAPAVLTQLLRSLEKHNHDDEVVFIDDASTDPEIQHLLQDLPRSWRVIKNQQNLGFVKTANKGLRLSDGHSILLNSDTLVSNDWLQKFKNAINTVDRLGTATPWSNNAEICSLPENLKNNPVPQNIDQLALELSQHHPTYPELPTAVGFCMLITAQAKQQEGYFDEDTFGIGYGEENDYSLRVTAQGLRNVLVDDCFVAHVGNQSFQALDLKPGEETMQRLLRKHPDYLQLIQNFIEKDPLATLRQSIIDKIAAF